LVWTVEFDEEAAKEFRKLDPSIQIKISKFLNTRILRDVDPHAYGKPLRPRKYGLWRYRIGDCRLICRIEEDRFVILVLRVGHRREIYK